MTINNSKYKNSCEQSKNCEKKSNSGFTLIELLLYVGIASTMLLSISLFFSSLLESRVRNQAVAEVEQQGIQVMELLTQTLRNADTINSPAAGASGATLSVDTQTAGNNPTVFDLASGEIRIKEGAGEVVELTSPLITASDLSFQNLSRSNTSGTVRIEFTLTFVNPEGRNEFNFSKSFIGSATLR